MTWLQINWPYLVIGILAGSWIFFWCLCVLAGRAERHQEWIEWHEQQEDQSWSEEADELVEALEEGR